MTTDSQEGSKGDAEDMVNVSPEGTGGRYNRKSGPASPGQGIQEKMDKMGKEPPVPG